MVKRESHVYWLCLLSMFFCAHQSLAATIYVDNTLSSDCISSYSIANRNCSGNNGNAYNTIQESINNCSAGDKIHMRGGTYHEIDIDIPIEKNGTAWTEGNYTTLASYPGEWAIIDGSGLNTGSEYRYQHIIRDTTQYQTGSISNATKYWLFERFEITGGRCAFWLTGGPMKFRYLYVHDNGRAVSDDLVGGIFVFTTTENVIEYNFFKDNEIPGSPSGNNFHILFDADYRDTSGDGKAFQPNACVHKNEVRYNYIIGGVQGIRLKGDQRFGYNDRDPRSSNTELWQYKDWGDKIHHNILLGVSNNPIMWGQDFSQVYNNIYTDERFEPAGKRDGAPVLYNQLIYNNTGIKDRCQVWIRGAGDIDSSSFNNFYNESHVHVWAYNNIVSEHTNNDPGGAFRIMSYAANDDWDASDAVIDRNLIHESIGYAFRMGNTSTGTGCSAEFYNASDFNSCSNTWRGTTGVENWEADGALFEGSSGAAQFITRDSFVLNGSTTVANGGFGGNHPYLSGVTIPSYVGATNPDDHAWVNGVLNNVSSTAWLRAQGAGDPSWIEGGDSSGGGSSQPSLIQEFQLEE